MSRVMSCIKKKRTIILDYLRYSDSSVPASPSSRTVGRNQFSSELSESEPEKVSDGRRTVG